MANQNSQAKNDNSNPVNLKSSNFGRANNLANQNRNVDHHIPPRLKQEQWREQKDKKLPQRLKVNEANPFCLTTSGPATKQKNEEAESTKWLDFWGHFC